MMRVAIVDDDPIVCSSLSTILKATGTADIAWTAYDGETAVGQYEEDNPDVLLIDVQMPVMDGLAASRKIIDAHPNAKILILTTFADESYIAEALEIGTKGYLIKQDVSSVIPAVQSVMAGQVVMGAQVLRKLHVNKASQTQRHVSQAGDNGENRFSGRFANLTERERDVMQLVAEGYDNREIAAKLFLSEGTVRNRISDILAKTNVTNRTETCGRMARMPIGNVDKRQTHQNEQRFQRLRRR